jgi:hypothetical protein
MNKKINLAIDIQIGGKRKKLLESMGYNVVYSAGHKESDEDWLNRAFSEGAHFCISNDADIPRLIEKHKYPMVWIDYPYMTIPSDELVQNIDESIRFKLRLFKDFSGFIKPSKLQLFLRWVLN